MLTPLNTFDINAFFKHFPKKETIFNSNENKILFEARKKTRENKIHTIVETFHGVFEPLLYIFLQYSQFLAQS